MASFEDYSCALLESENIVKCCFDQFGIEQVFVAFNGGKDCTVLLDLVLNRLKCMYEQDDVINQLKIYCIRTGSTFSELDEFMEQVEKYYSIKLINVQGEMKSTLKQITENDQNLKACLMGTRRTDPYSENLNFMQCTDPGWPPLIRVSPLLNWSYQQIWSYILERKVPYCTLYEKGYTSIGSTANTWPNPALATKDKLGRMTYQPAWCLQDGSLERAGRGTKPNLVSELNCSSAEHKGPSL